MINTNIQNNQSAPRPQNVNPNRPQNISQNKSSQKVSSFSVTKIVLIVALVAVAIYLGNNILKSNKSDSKDSTTQSQSANTSSLSFDDPNLVKVGNDVEIGKVKWNVMSTENIGNEIQPVDEKITDKNLFTTGKFLRIRVAITNTGDSDMTYSMDSMKISDSEDKEYSPSKDKDIYVSPTEIPSSVPIKAGATVVIAIVYDVPKSATKFNFLANDLSMKGKEVKKIFLGLN